MPIFEFAETEIRSLHKTTFSDLQLHERRDLQRLLRENISVIAPNTLIISEEYGGWDESRRRIDLLGIDRDANLVVFELKRTEDGGHMELQALRYASMVSTMTFGQAVDAYEKLLAKQANDDRDAQTELLDFLGWEEPDEDAFAQDVHIVLASAEFGRELTTSVLWLIERAVEIRCVRLQPYDFNGQVLVDVQQIIPLPEAAEYQIQVREKARKERESRTTGADYTRYDLQLGQKELTNVPKRRAIHQVFCYLVENDIKPELVAKHCGQRANRVIVFVEGEVGRDEFIRLISLKWAEQQRNFSQRRFFCEHDELVHVAGRTYAFSSQWGGAVWLQAMTDLRDAFPDLNIVFKPTE